MNIPELKAFIRPSKLDKTGRSPIQIRITLGTERVEISSGKYVLPTLWDKQAEEVMGRTEEARTINLHVARMKKDLEALCFEADLNRRELTAGDLRDAYQGQLELIHGRTLMSVLNEFVNNCELQRREEDDRSMEGYAAGTIAHFKSTRNKVQAFLKHKFRRADILLKQIDRHFLQDFDLYLRTVHETRTKNNTTVKTIKRLLGMTERYHHEFGVPNIRQTYDKTFRHVRKDHLTWEELELLENQEMPSERLERARDVFVFACYTALGYSELAALSDQNISKTRSGRLFISRLVRRKTGEEVVTPLLTRANRILLKYREDPECKRRGKLLPVLSNQKYNDYLKEIADICDIRKELTSHCARRTFAITVAGEHGLPLDVIARWLSHASTQTTSKYYHQVNERMLERASDDLEAQISKRYYRPESLFGAQGDI